ncbi:MAG: hypothetical protein F9K36_04335, partial [Burkholderiaceae bacterium]
HMAHIVEGRTVIVIAHRLSAVRHAHRIVALDQGRIVEAGSHEALLHHNGLYAHLWRLQSAGVGEPGAAASARMAAPKRSSRSAKREG